MDRVPDQTFRAGGMLLMGGAALALVGNALHPRFDTATQADPAASIAAIGESGIWVVDHLLILVGVLAITLGFVALAADLAREHHATSWALAAGVVTILTGGYAVTFIVIDAFAAPLLADAAGAAAAAPALSAIELGGFVGTAVLVFGVQPAALGMAVVRSETYPHWAGFVALAAAVLGVVAGVVMLTTGEVGAVATTIFLLSSIPATLVALYLGFELRRHHLAEPTPGRVPGPTPA